MFNTMIEAVGKGRDERDDEGSDELVRLRAIIAAQATALDAEQAEAAAARD